MNAFEYYKSELATKKTTAAKKTFLTKTFNELSSHLKDLLNYQKKGASGGMKYAYLHGEPITAIRISKIKTEIKVVEKLRSQL
ncbi:hypothetical protein [Flavobacterium commune]|uniref:Uncharacterized protein n=1 Tax=Flavobacterium commune TaxID=1306519 RepID=A0A1D9PAI6_9FLAO|nr:hypothetical protein [Flavobacterium commune]AOZ99583.1 hypothetical protein BIW12_09100 [Flavobacterium commune]